MRALESSFVVWWMFVAAPTMEQRSDELPEEAWLAYRMPLGVAISRDPLVVGPN